MSGSSVSRDGRSVVELYGSDLDQLAEGDTVGVSRSHKVRSGHTSSHKVRHYSLIWGEEGA